MDPDRGAAERGRERSVDTHRLVFNMWSWPILHQLESSWKWKMDPWKTIVLYYEQVVFRFHDDSAKCIRIRLG